MSAIALRFTPVFREYIWGGRRLASVLFTLAVRNGAEQGTPCVIPRQLDMNTVAARLGSTRLVGEDEVLERSTGEIADGVDVGRGERLQPNARRRSDGGATDLNSEAPALVFARRREN